MLFRLGKVGYQIDGFLYQGFFPNTNNILIKSLKKQQANQEPKTGLNNLPTVHRFYHQSL
jgi:hypothetical protein